MRRSTEPATVASPGPPTAAPIGLMVAAFGAVYVIWGSTYAAIRILVEVVPPLGSAGVRHTLAGLLLFAWTRFRGEPWPTRAHWRSGLVIGSLMLLGGNGGVSFGVTLVPSGVAALLIATVPLWMIALPWLGGRGAAPHGGEWAGLVLGFAGVWVLVNPTGGSAGGPAGGPGSAGEVPLIGAAVLLLAALSWACGSLLSRRLPLPASPMVATSVQMLGGGAALLVVSLGTGEWARFDIAAVTPASLLALAYLVIFGSLLAFTAYVWLLRVTSPAKVATYAYVNPLVAVSLGALLLDEPLTPRVFAATGLIVAAVVLTTAHRRLWRFRA